MKSRLEGSEASTVLFFERLFFDSRTLELSSADVPVSSSVVASVSVEDMVQTSLLILTTFGVQFCTSGTVRSLSSVQASPETLRN